MWIRHNGHVTRGELRELFERLHGEDSPEAPGKNFTDLADVAEVEFGFRERFSCHSTTLRPSNREFTGIRTIPTRRWRISWPTLVTSRCKNRCERGGIGESLLPVAALAIVGGCQPIGTPKPTAKMALIGKTEMAGDVSG